MIRLAMVALLGIGACLSAHATTYSVVGTVYTTAFPAYTTAMLASGSFTTSSPFPANHSQGYATYQGSLAPITSWSFSDGVNTFTEANSGGRFDIVTDARGNISGFIVRLTSPKHPNLVGQSVNVFEVSSTGPKYALVANGATCNAVDASKDGLCSSWSAVGNNAESTNLFSFAQNFPALPPTLGLAFSPVQVPLGGPAWVTFKLANNDPSAALTAVAMVDFLPPGVTVTSPNGLSNGCGGSVTAVPGTGLISLTGAEMPPGTTCTVTVSVTAATAGVHLNTAGPLTTASSLDGNAASATLVAGTLAPVPTMAPWAVGVLALLIGAAALIARRKEAMGSEP